MKKRGNHVTKMERIVEEVNRTGNEDLLDDGNFPSTALEEPDSLQNLKAEKARLEEAQDAMMAVISAKNAKINAHAAQLLSPTFLGDDDDSVLSYRLQIAPNQYTTFSMKQ